MREGDSRAADVGVSGPLAHDSLQGREPEALGRADQLEAELGLEAQVRSSSKPGSGSSQRRSIPWCWRRVGSSLSGSRSPRSDCSSSG